MTTIGFEPILQLKNKNDQDSSHDGDGEKRKKKKKKRRVKTVHKVITPDMRHAEERRKEVDDKIYAELSIPLPTDYRGPQFELR